MIQRRPWTSGIVALLVLVTLAIPLFSMRLAFTDASNDPTSLTTRQAFDLLAEGFGPGFNGPLVVAAPLSSATDVRHHGQARLGPAGHAGHRRSQHRCEVNADHSAAVIIAYPTTAPQAAQTSHARHPPPSHRHPRGHGGDGAEGAGRAGRPPPAWTRRPTSSHRLPWVITAVIVLAFLLLMAVFRSVVIPVKAAVMNLLSVGAAYGVIVAVFQWGWGGSVVGIGRTGPDRSRGSRS